MPCSRSVGPVFLVDSRGDIIRLGELQEAHIDVEVEHANHPAEDCNVDREFFIPVTYDYVGFRGGVGGTGWDPPPTKPKAEVRDVQVQTEEALEEEPIEINAK